MKRLLYIIICCTLAACDKMPANGDLDGMWQVTEIEHNGVSHYVSQDQVYTSFQLKLFMLGDLANPRRYYGYFEHAGDSLKFWKFSYASTNENDSCDNVPLSENDRHYLNEWGFYSLKESFKVDKLNSSLLIIHNDSTVIHYIKF